MSFSDRPSIQSSLFRHHTPTLSSLAVDSCFSAAQSSLSGKQVPNWTPNITLDATSGDLNADPREESIADQIGYSPMNGSNVFMDLQQVRLHA